MGQIFEPSSKDIILTTLDRLQSRNAGAGNVGNHVILLGANAGDNNTLDSIIALGNDTANAGLTSAVHVGSVFIAGGAGHSLVGPSSTPPAAGGAVLFLGENAGRLVQNADSSILIGNEVFSHYVGSVAGNSLTDMVVIGSDAWRHATGTQQVNHNVFIGANMGPSVDTSIVGVVNNVVLGGGSILQNLSVFAFSGNVVIGHGAGGINMGLGIVSDNVIIGQGAAQGLTSGSANILIGQSVAAAAGASNNIVLGHSASVGAGGTFNIVIGDANTLTGSGQNNVVIGRQPTAAGFNPALNNQLLLGSINGNLMLANFLTGNIILGNSAGANQEFAGITSTNIVKLVDGTVGSANPVGGGYFYSSGGNLHWFNSAGDDNAVTVAALTVGATAPAFVAANKPGATAGAGPAGWKREVIGGAIFWSPFWAN